MQTSINRIIIPSCIILVTLLCALKPSTILANSLLPVPIPTVGTDSKELVELGKQLFFDRRLSGDGTMSCATCHIPELGFTDGQAISLNYPTTKNWRNAPTLINLAYAKTFFHDGRAENLDQQALFPILSAFEMNQNLDYLEEEIRSIPEYVNSIQEIWGDPDVTRFRIARALAAFQKTLTSNDSPLDQFLRGDKQALTPKAYEGLQIFTGKGGCIACHDGINLSDDKFYALNVPEHPDFSQDPRVAATRRFVAKLYHFEEYRTLDEDPGRYLITKDKKDWKAFKTPTLREISQTGPYMHNGIFETLEEVIDFFDQGGGEKNQILQPLALSASEKEALKVFLTEGLTGKVPDFSFPKIP